MAATMLLDSRGMPLQLPASSPVRMVDSVSSAMQAGIASTSFRGGYAGGVMERLFAPQLAAAAYLTSGMLQKVIDIPAADRVREWRDWQADKDQIEAIEAEEKRLGLVSKVTFCEVLRGVGGGALILVTVGDHAQPLSPDAVARGGLVAVNVARRSEITPVDFDTDLASPTYGEPSMWQVTSTRGEATKIHPSRVIAFRGDPYPSHELVGEADRYWGLSRLVRVFREVQKADNAQTWFAELVRKAKLLRIGIPELTDFTATEGGQAKLDKRMATIAMGEGILNATVYDAGNGQRPAETITDYQVKWDGIPALMDAFDQRVAAVADIPFTRLMGRSPAGMNATGEHDDQNWGKAVVAGQKLELRPCLERLDPILLRSAGVADPSKVTWRFAPLNVPSEKEEADTFKTTMDAVTALQATGTIPNVAMSKGVQNLMSEREWVPGLDQALAEIPEAERFGLNAEPDPNAADPSALQAKGGDPQSQAAPGGDGSVPARRAANDKREVGEPADTPFGDAYDPAQPRGKNGRWVSALSFIEAVLGVDGDQRAQHRLGTIPGHVHQRLNRLGIARRPLSVALDFHGVRHTLKRHAGDSRGQKPIEHRDLALAHRILSRGEINHGNPPMRNGSPVVTAKATINGHAYTAVYEVRKYRAVLVTMRKR